ncbi:MAG: hypothetical protein KBD78_14140 [Oligoflexales bacterium]|nr:hypothetical protein [Oligoflexales bacterium]
MNLFFLNIIKILIVGIFFVSCTRANFSAPSPGLPPSQNPDDKDPPDGKLPPDIDDPKLPPFDDGKLPPPGKDPGQSEFRSCEPNNPNSLPIRVSAYKIQGEIFNRIPQPHQFNGDIEKYRRAAMGYKLMNLSMNQIISQQNPFTQFCMSHFNVPERDFNTGFPKNDGSGHFIHEYEWFALHASAMIVLDEPGNYSFALASDDGAVFYINSQTVVDNDGVHSLLKSPAGSFHNTRAGATLPFVVNYFQGPKWKIALQLYWKKPSSNHFEVIPPSAFRFGG